MWSRIVEFFFNFKPSFLPTFVSAGGDVFGVERKTDLEKRKGDRKNESEKEREGGKRQKEYKRKWEEITKESESKRII